MAKTDISFEKAMEKLEEIVNSLESGDFALEESLKLYEEGVKLVNLCNKKITNVEKSIKILLNSDGELIEEDFVSNDK
jgi:exodeoxyribonuclease VII small subunit